MGHKTRVIQTQWMVEDEVQQYKNLTIKSSLVSSKVTIRCSWKVSATGLPWLEHFTSALGKMLLSHQDLVFVLPIYLK